MKKFFVTGLFFISLIVVGYYFVTRDRGVSNEQPQVTASTTVYVSPKYGFSLVYPSRYRLRAAVFNDGMNVDAWSLTDKPQERMEQEPVDCVDLTSEELHIQIGIADLLATSTNLKLHSESVEKRYEGGGYANEVHGNKPLKVKRNIPGMCREATEALWKEPAGRYILIFSFPTVTNREQDYWNIIEAFRFND